MKKAMIFWFSEDDGGRKTPPKGAEYYPTIELEDEKCEISALNLIESIQHRMR